MQPQRASSSHDYIIAAAGGRAVQQVNSPRQLSSSLWLLQQSWQRPCPHQLIVRFSRSVMIATATVATSAASPPCLAAAHNTHSTAQQSTASKGRLALSTTSCHTNTRISAKQGLVWGQRGMSSYTTTCVHMHVILVEGGVIYTYPRDDEFCYCYCYNHIKMPTR